MRVAFIYQFLTMGGVGVQLRNRLAALAGHGVTASCHFLYDRGGAPLLRGVADVRIEHRPKRLVENVLADDPDVVVTIDTPQVFRFMEACAGRVRWLNELHSTTRKARHYASLHGLQGVQAHIVPSLYLQRRAVEQFGLSKDAVHVVPNGIDMSVFKAVPVQSHPRRPIVCWIGKLDVHKNWREFVDICAGIGKRREDAEFWVVGGDTATDRVVRQLAGRVVAAGLGGRLLWIDRVEYECMPRLYSSVAASGGLLLSTSRDESFGMTVLEAMACGCPVVAARVGALPELVVDDRTGSFYTLGECGAAADSVIDLLSNGALLSQRAVLAASAVRDKYTSERVAGLYHEILSGLNRAPDGAMT